MPAGDDRKVMSQTEDISASARTELHSAPSADSLPRPNDGVVDLHDFVFGDGKSLSSLKLHYLTFGTADPCQRSIAVTTMSWRLRHRKDAGLRCRFPAPPT
jgi:hypothetical protein